MNPEVEKPRVMEIQVRMDCNGCVQKIKKALYGISGIYDLYVDFPQQKLTIVGWADPEKIVKAIKKTRKNAVICIHAEPETQLPESTPEGAPPASGDGNPPPESQPPPPTEPPKDPPPPENPPAEGTSLSASYPPQPTGPKDVEEIHVIHHHQPDYGYGYNGNWNHQPSSQGYWNSHPSGHELRPEPLVHGYGYRPEPLVHGYRPEPQVHGHGFRPESQVHGHGYRPEPQAHGHGFRPESQVHGHGFQPEPPVQVHGFRPEPPVVHVQGYPPEPTVHGHRFQPERPVYATHSYNTYRPSPYISEYEYSRSPPQQTHYSRTEHYNDDYYNRGSGSGNRNNITSMFSDENPNACKIV